MSIVAYWSGDAVVTFPISAYGEQLDFVEMSRSLSVSVNETIGLSKDGSEMANRSAVRHSNFSIVSVNYSLPMMIIVATLLSALAIVTAFGNLLVGLALFRYRQLRTISNCLIGNLALSDFLLATTVLPLSIANECLGHWTFGPLLCRMWLVMDVLYCTASIWNLCMIAVDRFTATLYPVWYRDRRSAQRRIFVYVGLIWSISAAICVPPLLGWNDLDQSYKVDSDSSLSMCLPFQTRSYVLYSAAGSFFVPFVLTFVLYVGIFCAMRRLSSRLTFVLYVGIFCAMRRLSSRRRNRQRRPLEIRSAAQDHSTSPTPTNGSLLGSSRDIGSMTSVAMSSRRLVEKVPSDASTLSATSCYGTNHVAAVGIKVDINNGLPDIDGLKVVERSSLGVQGRFDSLDEQPEITPADTDHSRVQSVDNNRDDVTVLDVLPERPSGRDITNPLNDQSQMSKDTTHLSLVTQPVPPSLVPPSLPSRNRLKHAATLVIARRYGVTFNDQQDEQRTHRLPSFPGRTSDDVLTTSGLSGDATRRRLTLRPSAVAAAAASAFVVTLRTVSQKHRYEQREMRATIRMAIIIAFFCCMWLGFFVIYVVSSWCPVTVCHPVPRPLEAFLFWLGYSNSSVNPILYTIFNEDFRRAFQKIIGCGMRERQNSGGPGGTDGGVDGHRRMSLRSAVL